MSSTSGEGFVVWMVALLSWTCAAAAIAAPTPTNIAGAIVLVWFGRRCVHG